MEPQKLKVGTIKGVRKDHLLLNLFSFPALTPTGKIVAIKLEQVEMVQDLDKLSIADSQPDQEILSIQPDQEILSISMPIPVRIKTAGLDFELKAPHIRLAAASPLTETKSTEVFTALFGLLKRIGKSNNELLV